MPHAPGSQRHHNMLRREPVRTHLVFAIMWAVHRTLVALFEYAHLSAIPHRLSAAWGRRRLIHVPATILSPRDFSDESSLVQSAFLGFLTFYEFQLVPSIPPRARGIVAPVCPAAAQGSVVVRSCTVNLRLSQDIHIIITMNGGTNKQHTIARSSFLVLGSRFARALTIEFRTYPICVFTS